jgi:AcrR family transcriptional regulator
MSVLIILPCTGTEEKTVAARRTRPAARPGKPGAGKRIENKERTRKAILAAASRLFSTKGFHRTTTRAVSRKAGIAEGTLFNYFRTKEDLAVYFFQQQLGELMDWFRRNKRLQRAPLSEKLFAIIHYHLEQIGPYEEFIGAVYLRALQPASKLSPLSLQAQQHNLRYLGFIREILARAEEAGEIPPLGDIGAYGFALFHGAMITYWLQDQSPGKENTLALLDRGLKLAASILKKGDWEW